MLKKLKWHEILMSIMLIAGGAVLLMDPGMTLVTITKAIGFLLIAAGVIFMISYFLVHQMIGSNYNLVQGIVLAGAGAFICLNPDVIVSVLPMLLGLGVAISGVVKFQRAIDLARMHYSSWVGVLIPALINILIGLLVFLNPFSTAELLMRIIGAGLVFSGVTDLITTIFLTVKVEKYIVRGKAEEIPMPPHPEDLEGDYYVQEDDD